MMDILYIISGFLFGAAIPGYLLWQKSKECQHLLNVILKQQKAPTLDRPFEGIPEKAEGKDKGPHKDRRSRPTAIDITMGEAERLDTKQYLHDNGIQTEH